MKNSLSLLVVAFDNREEYIQKINNLGVKTSSAYRGNRWFFMRTMRRIWFYCHLPFKSIWYNKQLKNIQYENVIIYDAGITLSFLSWFRANTQVQNVYFVYLNIVSTTLVKPDARVRALCNRIITFDYDEAIKYNIFFDKGGYPLAWTREKRTPLWDIIFVGRDKGRLDKLLILKHEFERYNLKTYFHIVGNRNYFNYNSKYKYKYNN